MNIVTVPYGCAYHLDDFRSLIAVAYLDLVLTSEKMCLFSHKTCVCPFYGKREFSDGVNSEKAPAEEEVFSFPS